MSKPIKEQNLLYHLTPLKNISGIVEKGLLARSLVTGFKDIADPEIIEKRKELELLEYVPFHFFFKNPFDGRVQKDHPKEQLVYIAVWRTLAREKGWKIIPKHPASCDPFTLYEYDRGFASIDWELMEERDYRNDESKSTCMAECLAYRKVDIKDFAFIYTKDDKTSETVKKVFLPVMSKCTIEIDARPHYFL
jgi:hypothetical protein